MRYFQKKTIQAMEAWHPDYDMTNVSVSVEDSAADSPKIGDFIATNPSNPNDKWLVAEEFIKENYIEVNTSSNGLTFGQAIEAAKNVYKIAREGWNGQGMFAYIVPSASYQAQTGVAKKHFGENALVPYRAYWALKTAQEDVATWSPSGSDSLAEDWMIVE